MELTFQSSPLRFLRCVMQEVHFQEETSDTIVPDSYPDIAYIAACHADVILRGKDCRDHHVTVAGGIKGSILYVPEGDTQPKSMDVYIPFTMKFEHMELSEQSQIICSMRIRSVDARMVNSRKATLRVGIGCELTAYENAVEELYEFAGTETNIQTKYNQYRVNLPLETGEKSFVIQDTIDFSGHPTVEQICKFRCELLQADQRIVGNKIIFKGSLVCKVLYLTTDHKLHVLQHIFPYSQYCELSQEYDDELVQIEPVITGYDIETNQALEPDRAEIHVHVLAQCLITGNKELLLLNDAYAMNGDLDLKWKEYGFSLCLDHQCTTETIRKQLNGEGQNVIDTDVYWDYPIVKRSHETVQISQPVTFHVLTSENDQLQNMVEHAETTQELLLADHCICHAETLPTGELYAFLTGDGTEVRCGVQICTDCYTENKLRAICGGEIIHENTKEVEKSTIIVRKVSADTVLWDLAKAYRTTEKEIMEANNLDSDRIAAETMLLLPVL